MTAPVSQQITRSSGSNLALSFISLPKEKQQAMSVFYAYCRVADDIVDDPQKSAAEKRSEIDYWRHEIRSCYEGTPDSPLGRELQETVRRYLIPPRPLLDLLDGVEMDITQNRYANFADVSLYCYRVASAVGLVSIEIFGYTNPLAKDYAVALGMAFQLTNILRDIRFDLDRYQRIYVPLEEMTAFGVSEADLLSDAPHPGKSRLLRLQSFRAEHYFMKAARLLPREDRANFIAAELMTEVYHRLLRKIQRHNFQILSKPVRLGKAEKILAVGKARRSGAALYGTPLSKPMKVAVWGGGFAGLSAALHLAHRGHEVELFEGKAYLGGRAHSFKDAHLGVTLDNGQHVFMGCYRACKELFNLLGISDKLVRQDGIEVPYLLPDGARSILKASPLPAPLHLTTGLIGFNALNWLDRAAILRFGTALRLGFHPSASETVEGWLKSLGQTDNAIRCLWEPFCIAALNEPVQSASAKLFARVVRDSLGGSREDSSIYLSRVGLSDLLMPEAELFLKSTGSKIHLNTAVREVLWDHDRVTGFITGSGSRITADCYVSALPSGALTALLPETSPLREKLRGIKTSPIISLHLLTDCPIVSDPFVGLLDSPVQWIFDRSEAWKNKDGYLSAIVISAAYDLMELKTPELLARIWSEINKFFPATRHGKILHHVFYKSKDATFAAVPATEALRPETKSEWSNLYLAGDWVQTGLPATLEGAVLSGRQAAEALDACIE